MIRPFPFFLFVIYLTALSTIEAQEAPDSLKNKSLEELIDLIKCSDLQEAKNYEGELMRLDIPDTTKINAYFTIYKHFYDQDKYKRSRHYLDKALEIPQILKDKSFLREVYLRMGNSYLMEWDNDKALKKYNMALDLAEQTKNVKREIIIRINIAIILKRISNPKKALKVCKTMLQMIDKAQKNTPNHARMLGIITDVSLNLEHYENVLKYAGRGIRMSYSRDHTNGLVDLYTKKGAAFYYKGDYDNAHYFLKVAKNIMLKNSITTKILSFNINYFSALVLYDRQRYEEVIPLLEEITYYSDGFSGYPRFIEAHKLLSKCYEQLGDAKIAGLWHAKYENLNRQFEHDKEEMIYEMGERLQHNNDELRIAIQALKNKNKYSSIILMTTLLLLAGIIMLYIRKQQSNKKRFRILLEKINLLEQQPKDKTTSIVIDDNTVHKILEKIDRLEKEQYFLSVDCSLRTMGKKVKTNATYLSKIINEHKGKNFTDYINELRIDYVLKKIKNDERFRRFSVEGIALEVGYKSVNSFTKHFRSKTGLNPSYYIKNIHKFDRG